MTHSGHIRVGTYAEFAGGIMRPYQLYPDVPQAWKRFGLNPQAPKLSQGSKSLEDEEHWEYWVQETWEDGIGRMRPHENPGLLYGELLSYVPSQLMLPTMAFETDTERSGGFPYPITWPKVDNLGDVITVGTGDNQKLGWYEYRYFYGSSYQWSRFYFLLISGAATNMTMEIWRGTDDPADGPITLEDTTFSDISYDNTRIYQWHDHTVNYNTGYVGGAEWRGYWVIMYPTAGTIDLLMSNAEEDMPKPYWWNGSTWTEDTVSYMGSNTSRPTPAPSPIADSSYAWDPVNNRTLAFGGTKVWYWDDAAKDWVSWINGGWGTWQARVGGKFMHGMLGDLMIGCSGYSGGIDAIDVVAGTYKGHDSSFDGNCIVSSNGFLYVFGDEDIYYTADQSWPPTWVGPVKTGTPHYPINGAAVLDGNVYFANAEALWIFAPGDMIVGVAPWGVIEKANGTNLLTWKGQLYCIAERGIAQISSGGQITDIWLDRQADLPADRAGSPLRLTNNNNYLFALVPFSGGGNLYTVWAYDGVGWSHICVIPNIGGAWMGMYFDRVNSYLWVGNNITGSWYIPMPDQLLNPYNDPNSVYWPHGWAEWDWWQGGVRTLEKDFESITLLTEGVTANQTITVYYKTIDDADWVELGTATENDVTLRFDGVAGNRPSAEKLKLAMKMETDDQTKTPLLRSMIMRYRTKSNDRYGWRISFVAGDKMEFVDGTIQNEFDYAEQVAHLDGLQTQTPPFIFEDTDGKKYEVDCVDYDTEVIKYERIGDVIDQFTVYRWTLEQVTSGTCDA